MATFRHTGTIHTFQTKLIEGMIANGYEADFAERCFKQIEGFGDYGFPESHVASFALLVYVSAWLKHHYPGVFAAAILNSQPMGFYAPAQLVRDAQNHGVQTRPIDINHSHWNCTLEEDTEAASPSHALRLGLCQIKGFLESDAERLITTRRDAGHPFTNPADLWRRAGLSVASLKMLARADAYGSVGLTRRQALWAVHALGTEPLPLFAAGGESRPDPEVQLPLMSLGEEVSHDYAAFRLSLKHHPVALMRERLTTECVTPAERLALMNNGSHVTVAGLVLIRQRPGTASGVIFITLEDETGVANLVVWPKTFERYRRDVMTARMLRVTGELQREGIVIHLIAHKMEDMTDRLHALITVDIEAMEPSYASPVANRCPPGQDRKMYPSRDFH